MSAQQNLSTITTTGVASFCRCSTISASLFRVNPDIPATDALDQASVLMDCINRLTLIGGADAENGAPVWAAHYLGEQVKAIIDDLAASIRG